MIHGCCIINVIHLHYEACQNFRLGIIPFSSNKIVRHLLRKLHTYGWKTTTSRSGGRDAKLSPDKLISQQLVNIHTFDNIFFIYSRGYCSLAEVCLEFVELCLACFYDIEVSRWQSSKRFDWIASILSRCVWHNRLNPKTYFSSNSVAKVFWSEYQLTMFCWKIFLQKASDNIILRRNRRLQAKFLY